jgi:hypothetical protein
LQVNKKNFKIKGEDGITKGASMVLPADVSSNIDYIKSLEQNLAKALNKSDNRIKKVSIRLRKDSTDDAPKLTFESKKFSWKRLFRSKDRHGIEKSYQALHKILAPIKTLAEQHSNAISNDKVHLAQFCKNLNEILDHEKTKTKDKNRKKELDELKLPTEIFQEGTPNILTYKDFIGKDLNEAQRLIDTGADINSKDSEGCTPLANACQVGNTRLVTFLIEKGADIETKDDSGKTPLIQASRGPGHAEIAKLLIEKGADIEAKDDSEKTPLGQACPFGLSEIVQLLIKKGAALEAKNSMGETPLIEACRLGKKEIIRLLEGKAASKEGL